jgi:N-acetylneuraminic acid mutarotase
MGGSENGNRESGGVSSVYGKLGVPSASNMPGARDSAVGWTDASGNLWLFGGTVNGGDATTLSFNDLWEYTPSTGYWTWMGGSSTPLAAGVYGTEGVANAANMPGARNNSVSWKDASGNFWLFGGAGTDSNGVSSYLNDLWEYNLGTKEWTWMSGSNIADQPGTYGTQGTPAETNTPGASENAVGWTDASGNLWLFGGDGYAAPGSEGYLNDLWEYKPSTGEWTWVDGSNLTNQPGVLVTTSPTGNIPGATYWATGWADATGNLWLFGGQGITSTDPSAVFNDLWEYKP